MRSTARYRIAALCVLWVTGCGQNVTANKPVSKADIAAIEVTLTSVVRLANVCLQQPVGPCTSPTVRPKLIADIHKAADAFYKVRADNIAGLPVSTTALDLAMSQIVADTPATK